MLFQPTLREMLGTLPPAEQAELLVLLGRAAAADRREDPPEGGTP